MISTSSCRVQIPTHMICKGEDMSKGKARWYPDKPQNNKQIPCPRYEEYPNGGSGHNADDDNGGDDDIVYQQ